MPCMTADAPDPVVPPSEYVRSLPLGEELSLHKDYFAWDVFPFQRDEQGRAGIRRLDPPVLPEPPRGGEDGPEECVICQKPDSAYLWTDEHWRVAMPEERGSGPAVLFL